VFAVTADVGPALGHPAERIAEALEALVAIPAVTEHEPEAATALGNVITQPNPEPPTLTAIELTICDAEGATDRDP